MGKLVVGALASVLVGAALATGATFAVIASSAPDDKVQFSPIAPVNNSGAVDYGTP
ncbi:hypothetical protein ACTG9Q_10285 [Actinokineospora sp. 24-640]